MKDRHDHYTYRIHFSPGDGEFVARVAEWPSLSWLDSTPAKALAGAQRLVGELLLELEQSGEDPPIAIVDRNYSGKFVVRIPAEQHRALALQAAEQNVSLNRLVASRLSVGAGSTREQAA